MLFRSSGAGQDFVYGGSGNDALNALEAGIDNGIGEDVYIGSGKDTLNTLEAGIANGDDLAWIEGTTGPDSLPGTSEPNLILALAGNDTVNGFGGDDLIFGDVGNSLIPDAGAAGNDLLYGGAGLDSIYGGSGNDTLNAEGPGVDRLFGEIGNDVYIVYTTADILVENPNQGIDIVRSSASYTLDANVENLLLTGTASVNGTGNNLNNQIRGNSRNNTLNGGGGNDTLNGGGGNDILTGGLGSNQFLFNTAVARANVDRITDFHIRSNDKILLDKSVFSALDTRPRNVLLATDFAVINVAPRAEVVAAGNSMDEIVYNRRTGNLFYNPNNDASGFGRGGGRFATITFAGSNNLSNTHFGVVA